MTKAYTETEMKAWHDEVCRRDNYVCNGCGVDFSYPVNFNEKGRNQKVCGDHFPKTKGSDIREVLNPNNGRCVCFHCHELVGRGLTIEEAGILRRKALDKQKTKNRPTPVSLSPKKKKTEKFWGQSAKPWQGSKKGKKPSRKKNSIKITKVYNRHTGKLEIIK